MAYIGVSPQNGVRKKHTYTSDADQTSFTGAGAEGITLSYKDSNFVDVYQNGVKLAEADYTSTTGTTIVLAQGAAANDIVEIIVFDVFSTSDMVSASDGGTFAGNVAMSGTLTLTGNGDFNGDLDVDGTLETDALTINGVTLAETISDTVGAMVSSNTETGITVTYQDGDNTLDFVVGTLNQDTTGTAANATLAATVTVTDSTANTNFPIVFHDESNALLDDTGALRYNPSTGELLVPKLTVAGTTTTVDTVTMNAANAVVFEGATADAHETTLTIVDPTADRTINLPNVSGTIPVLAAASNTAITSTPAELNILDGATVVVGEINALDLGSTAVGTAIASKAVILDSNKDYTGIRNFTTTGVVTANAGVVVDNITIDGTEIDLSSGDLTLDVAGNIVFDSDTGIIKLADGGTNFGQLDKSGNNLRIISSISDGDIVFRGDDGGSGIDALTLDMSDGGTALFNHDIKLTDNSIALFGTGNDLQIYHDGNDSNIADVGTGTLLLKTDGAGIYLQKGSSETLAQFKTDAEVNLYYDNSKTFETVSGGAKVTGDLEVTDDIDLNSDSAKITFGGSSETIILEHVADTGLNLQGSGTNTNFSLLAFHTSNSTVADLRLGKSSSNTVGTFAETANGGHIGQIRFTGQDTGGNTREAAQITVVQSDDSTSNSVPANMRFSTGGGERARFNDNGYIEFRGASQVRVNLGNAGTAGTNNSNWIRGSGNQIDLNTNGGGYGFEVSGNTQLLIATNGAVTSQAGTYGSISDENLKENIADANSQWDDIKALRIRNYSMISDSLDTADKIGVIAQELESAGMNGLVEETNWRNQTVKSVKQSILYMKAVKALQEAMTRIETLETAKTDLEARITALESA